MQKVRYRSMIITLLPTKMVFSFPVKIERNIKSFYDREIVISNGISLSLFHQQTIVQLEVFPISRRHDI